MVQGTATGIPRTGSKVWICESNTYETGGSPQDKEFVAGGGFMFAMCSATETLEVALAAEGIDIVDEIWDGDGVDTQAQKKIDFSKTFAFENFTLSWVRTTVGYSSIDNKRHERGLYEGNDFFSLFAFSAKWDPVPTCFLRTMKKQ
jgi:hypothetical protein